MTVRRGDPSPFRTRRCRDAAPARGRHHREQQQVRLFFEVFHQREADHAAVALGDDDVAAPREHRDGEPLAPRPRERVADRRDVACVDEPRGRPADVERLIYFNTTLAETDLLPGMIRRAASPMVGRLLTQDTTWGDWDESFFVEDVTASTHQAFLTKALLFEKASSAPTN